MTPFETYRTYLAIKKHFSDPKYDFYKYNGKMRASEATYNKRKDRYYFERLSRNIPNDKELINYFVCYFSSCVNPSNLWIGDMMSLGSDSIYKNWNKINQSLNYTFKEETKSLLQIAKLNELFDTKNGHPILLKKYLAGTLSLQTLVIYDIIFAYSTRWDKVLTDPMWELVSQKIKKYKSFITINPTEYKLIITNILKELL
jgi:hypothetical protein